MRKAWWVTVALASWVGPAPPAAGAPVPARATPPDTLPAAALAAADSLVASWVAAGRVPGAVLLVAEDGRTVLERSYGFAEAWGYGDGQYGEARDGAWRTPEPASRLRRLDPPAAMEVGTVFDLASLTKVMATTFAVMALVDEGALDLDAPVATWLPDFRGGGKEGITPRQLLTHTAGLRQWTPVYYHAATAEGAYAYIRDLPLGWGVGEGRHYSDLGFMLLGLVVERVSGRPLEVFLEERFYGPLGLARTGFRRTAAVNGITPLAGQGVATDPPGTGFAATSHGNPYEYRMVHDVAFGYRIEGDPTAWDGWRRYTLRGEVNDGNAFHAFGGVAGHAGLFSTASELGVLLQLLLDRGEAGGRRYLRAETVERFLTPHLQGQALGWQVPGYAPGGSFAHTGFTGTWVLGVPSRGLAVVLLTNRQHGWAHALPGRGAAAAGGGGGAAGGGRIPAPVVALRRPVRAPLRATTVTTLL